jgi:hypothetical protein
LLALTSACQRKVEPISPESIFPANNEASGWVKAAAARTFNAADLYRYIDGDAERYIQAGVVKTFTADYRFREKYDAVADVYVMGSPEGARKIMEGESSSGSRQGDLGEASRIFGQSLVFREGRFLVRLTAYDESTELGTGLVDLGRAIDRKLK